MTIAHISNNELGFDVRAKLNALIDQANTPALGTGDVVGPASAIADQIAVYDGVTGKLIKDGGQSIAAVIAAAISGSGSGDVVGPASAINDHLAVYDGVTGKLIKDGGQSIAAVIAAATANSRIALTANTDYYVDNTLGSDANDGAIGTPWATLQHVVDYLAEEIDFNNKIVTIHVADSVTTYPGVALRAFVGGGDLVFLGNNAALGNVKIGNGPMVGAVFSGPAAMGEVLFWISGFEFVQTSGAALDFDGSDRGSALLGEPTFLIITCNKFSSCQTGGYVLIGNIYDNCLGTSIIDGAALNTRTPRAFYGSFNVNTYSNFFYLPNFTITGSVTFSIGFALISAGIASFMGTATGTTLGPKFVVGAAGTIYLDSLTQLPGSLPGTNYGGQIAFNGDANAYLGPWPTAKSLQIPTTGFSITIADATGALILKPAGTLATGAITLPANPIDQQRLTINSTNTVTALTISPNVGQSVTGNPATIAAGTAITAIYNASDTNWYMASSPAGGGGGGMAIGSAVTGGTNGSILYVDSGNLAQQNANLYFDDANNALKIGSGHTYNIGTFRALYQVPNASGDNWFEGDAGNPSVTGNSNFGTGHWSMLFMSTGSGNTAVGISALQFCSTGNYNFAFGVNALSGLTTGSYNVAVGPNAMQGGSTQVGNLAIGSNTMPNVGTTAAVDTDNVAVGDHALGSYLTGIGTIGIGGSTAINLPSGNLNTFIGFQTAGALNGASSTNTIVGARAGWAATTMQACTILGSWGGPAGSMSNIIVINDGNTFATDPKADCGYSNAGWTFAGSPKAGAPANTDLPAGYFSVIDDTSAGKTWLAFNKAGVIRQTEIGGGGGGGMAIGGAITGGTAGRVLFAGAGGILDDDSTFLWNDTLKDLAIGGAYYVNAARALYVVPHVTENNWFEGNSGNQTVSGYGNFGTGDLALSSVTTGYDNVALGTNALQKATSGYQNFAMGSNALRQTLTDSNNVAIGYNAMTLCGNAGAGGGSNVNNLAFGFAALALAEQAANNVVLGFGALSNVYTPATAHNNTIIGSSAGGNIGIGAASVVTGNTMIGYKAGYNLTGAPINNVFIGGYQGPAATISYNIAISEGAGLFALLDWNITTSFIWTMNYSPSLGAPTGLHIYNYQDAMTSTANYERAILDWRTSNVFTIGTQAGGTGTLRPVNIIGSALTFNGSPIGGGGMAIGGAVTGGTNGSILYVDSGNLAQQNANLYFDDANNALKIGSNHTYNIDTFRALYRVANASGDNWFEGDAGNPSVTGYENFGTGSACLLSLTTGFGNTGVGTGSMNQLTTGNSNFAFGTNALRSTTNGSYNVAIGPGALQNGTSTMSGNVAMGLSASPGLGTTGPANNNVAIGSNSLSSMGRGGGNIAIGNQAGNSITTDADYLGNVIIGSQAMLSASGSNLQNTVVGSRAGFFPSQLTACTILGVWAGPSTSLSNIIAINDGAGVYFGCNQAALDWNYTNNGIWSFHRLTTAQGLHVYNTFDDAVPTVNYERGIVDWRASSNVFWIGTQAGGTGTKRLTAVDGFAKAGAPAAGDLPAGSFALIDDTSAGQTWLTFNKAGTIRKVQLT